MTLIRDPESREDAENHINQIRQDKGLIAGQHPNSNVSDLERALKIVSDELNHNSFHFLLEFIQNADDNAYEISVQPTLDISYRRGFLRIDCNEIGFSAGNVESICKIGSSTKAGANKTKGYVGEKGIGFKSVFKVANIVHIASRHYTFMFDKSKLLGMIAPVWTSLPVQSRHGWTTFYLQLSEGCDKDALMKEINSLDPRMLIFLRKLRCINITIEAEDGRITRRALSRLPDDNGLGERTIKLRHDNEMLRYIVTTHRVEDLPSEEKRANVHESEILLAFPIDEECHPKIEPQQVFAFLPIRHYGFEFLLQADFLLIASREDISRSFKWNKALRDAAVDALIKAAQAFNRGRMKYTWLRYLPLKDEVSGFFERFKNRLLDQISNEPLLENWNDDMVQPSTLTFVSKEKFADSTDRPMTLAYGNPNKASVYLSPRYSDADLDYLKAIGVKEMSNEDFLRDLASFMDGHFLEFQERPLEWHTRLAEVLIPLALNPTLLPSIKELKLVHLRDGRWVSVAGHERSILFPGEPDGCEVPSGIDFLVVHQRAALNPLINQLYSSIGVHHFSVSRLFDFILEMHKDPNFNPRRISRGALISQAAFLYSAGWRVERNARIWFVSERNERVLASRLYMDSEEEHSASSIFVNHRNRFPFLHPEYLSAIPGNRENWLRWLVEELNVAIYPRIHKYVSETSFDLSNEFRFISVNRPIDFLVLLKNRWDKYSSYIEKDENQAAGTEPNVSRTRIRENLAAVRVRCQDRQLYRLDQTFLPLEELVSVAQGCVPFLDVPDPQDRRWLVALRPLGVGIKNDLNLYLRALQSLQGTDVSQTTVSTFLEQIQARSSEDEVLIRTRFREANLIYVRHAGQNAHADWVRPDDCVWKGPTCIRKFSALSEIYPENRRLFCDILGIQDANLDHLVREAKEFSVADSLPYIIELLQEVEKYIKDETPESSIRPLRDSNVFPIHQSSASARFELSSPGDSLSEWFIADCTHLEESFRGKLPMLAFSVGDTGRIKRLLRMTGAENRKLSHAARGDAETVGNPRHWQDYTDTLRSKVNSILRLVPDTETNRQRIFQQLRAVEAYQAPRVIQHWSVQYNRRTIQGEPETGYVALKSYDTSLHIYFAEGSTETSRCKRELVERLSSFCGFSNATNTEFDRKYLLLNILDEPDLDEIDVLLDRERVPPLVSDNDLAEEAEREQNASQTRQRSTAKGNTPSTTSFGSILASQIDNLLVFGAKDWDASTIADTDECIFAQGPPSTTTSNGGIGDIPGFRNVRIFGFGRQGPRPRGLGVIQQDERTLSEGEIHVSTLLGTILGTRYVPDIHWTSKYRTRAGHSPYNDGENTASTFTIPDQSGVLTAFLIRAEVLDARFLNLRPPPTYHLEVKSSRGEIESEFTLNSAQFERARRFRFNFSEGTPSNVTILVRVFNMDIESTVHMFVDIWECYMRGRLRLMAVDGFRAQISVQTVDVE